MNLGCAPFILIVKMENNWMECQTDINFDFVNSLYPEMLYPYCLNINRYSNREYKIYYGYGGEYMILI